MRFSQRAASLWVSSLCFAFSIPTAAVVSPATGTAVPADLLLLGPAEHAARNTIRTATSDQRVIHTINSLSCWKEGLLSFGPSSIELSSECHYAENATGRTARSLIHTF